MTIKTVYTHLRPGHIDDVVGASVLAALLMAEVKFVHPQDPALPSILADPNAATVDVGGHYDPARMHFDHHHDASLPCAAVLVLQEVPAWQSSAAWTYMSIKDTQGPHEAARQTREVSTEADIATERRVACMSPSADLGMAWLRAGLLGQRFHTFGDLVGWLHERAGDERINEAERVLRMTRARSLLALEISRSVPMVLPDGEMTRVVLPGDTHAHGHAHAFLATEAFHRHNASIAVSYSEWPGEKSTWKITRAESLQGRIDFSRLRGASEVSFAHNSGHMAVLHSAMPTCADDVTDLIRRAWTGATAVRNDLLKSA